MTSPSPIGPVPSPKFFGNSTTIPAVVFNAGHASSDDGSGGGGDPKRRRIARACDMCRKKKIKCDGKIPACGHCVNSKTDCVFTLVEKKRNPPKGAKYIEGLENRLGRMESLLKLSGLLPEGDIKADLGDLERRLQDKAQQSSVGGSVTTPSNVGRSSSESIRDTPSSSTLPSALNSPAVSKDEDEVEALSDQMCSLVTNNYGESRFIGSSSGFSILSPQGIRWVNEKTGDKSFQNMINEGSATGSKWGLWRPDVFGPLFERRGVFPYPPRELAATLVQDFFQNFNVMFPLFHKPTFDHLLNKQYSDDPPQDSGWYAAFNMVLAISYRLHSRPPTLHDQGDPLPHVQNSWRHFGNAAAVLTELLLKNTDLLSIQAILGMALFLLGTANAQPSYLLIAAAVRISNSIGMHRRGNSFGLNAAEVEQRRRVFWIMYLMDKDMALRSGRPPCINDDDISVDLPDENPVDGVGNIFCKDGRDKINLFRHMSLFAVIQSKVYMQLYSAKASKQSDGELLNTIGDLDRELEEWKELVPVEYRPDSSNLSTDQAPLHLVMLHFSYYNCLTTIHRMSIHHGYWSSRLSNYAISGLSARPPNPRIFSSAGLCVSAARSSINLLKCINGYDYSCIWQAPLSSIAPTAANSSNNRLVVYYPVSALVTLFANTLQNPQDPRARSDLRLMTSAIDFLGAVKKEDDRENVTMINTPIQRMLGMCIEFRRISQLVLDKADKEMTMRRKRKNEEPQPPQWQERQQQHEDRPRGAHFQDTSSGSLSTDPLPTATTATTTACTMAATTQNVPEGLSPPDTFNPDMASHLYSDLPTFRTSAPPPPMSWLADLSAPQPTTTTTATTTTSSAASPFPVSPLTSTHIQQQQPFVPQDLWQMPMSFEWDWADVTSNMAWGDSSGL